MKKKLLCICFSILMFTSSAYAADMKICVNGKYITPDTPAEIKDNNVFVPVSFISDELGAKAVWEDSKAVITKDDSTFILVPGSKTAYKNDTEITLSDDVYISNDRTFVSLSSIETIFGCGVKYDSQTGIVSIDSMDSEETDDMTNPPKIVLENHNANFVTLPVNWNGKTSDIDINEAVRSSETADTNIFRPQVNEHFKFSFENAVPDKVSVSMAYFEDYDNKLPKESVPVFKDGNTFEFINQPIPSITEPVYGSRIYIIEAAWGENVCQYAFVTDNKFIYLAYENLEHKLKEIHAMDHCIIGNYVYYAVLGDEEGFHRMLLDGTEDKRICDFSSITSSIGGSNMIRLTPSDDNSILCEIQPMREYGPDGTLSGPFPIDYYKINLSDYTVVRLDTQS